MSVKTGQKKKTKTSSSASVCRVITNLFPLSTPSPVDPHHSYHPLLKHPQKKEEKGKRTKNSRVKEGVNWDVGEGRIIRVDARMHNGAASNV